MLFNPLSGKNAPYFIILLCLMPDGFTHQGESAATQWVNQSICPCTPLAQMCPTLLFYSVYKRHTILLCQMPDDFTCQGGDYCHSMVKWQYALLCYLTLSINCQVVGWGSGTLQASIY